jgi:hypothetical protein
VVLDQRGPTVSEAESQGFARQEPDADHREARRGEIGVDGVLERGGVFRAATVDATAVPWT